jgi:hypothetical protein
MASSPKKTYKCYILLKYTAPIKGMIKIGEKVLAKGELIYLRYSYKEIRERLSFIKNEFIPKNGFLISKDESDMHKNYITCYGKGQKISYFNDKGEEVHYYHEGIKTLYCIIGLNQPYESIKEIEI